MVDLNLTAMSGLDLVDLLRQRGATLPVVAISAHDESSNIPSSEPFIIDIAVIPTTSAVGRISGAMLAGKSPG